MSHPTPEALRREFLLREDVVFLNHGSFGACPRPVFAVYQDLQRELEAQPVAFLDTQRTLTGRLAAARARLAEFLGADRDEIVFVPNATTGVNIVARSLDLQPGDEVLATDHEYGAVDRCWEFLCAKAGANYVRQPLPAYCDNPGEVVDAVWRGVTPRTRVLAISHITSPSALVLPVAELVARSRERGLITVIDGAHAPNQLDLDLHALGADFYTGNCHKWLMAPKGAAFLYARTGCQDLVEPLVVSWGWRSGHPGPSRFVDEQEWTGTRDPSAALSVPAALDFCRERDWPAVRRECRERLLAVRDEFLAWSGEAALSSAGPWLAQMAALPLPAGVDPLAMGRFLREQRRLEIPVYAFQGRGWVRLSVQGYNTAADLEALLQGVREFRT